MLTATLQSWKPKVLDTIVTKVLTLPPPPRYIQSPDAQFVQHTQIITIRSQNLDPDYTDRPLSLKEKFFPKRKSKLPFAAVTLNLQTPTAYAIRTPLSLILSLSHSATSSSLSSETTLPPIYLKESLPSTSSPPQNPIPQPQRPQNPRNKPLDNIPHPSPHLPFRKLHFNPSNPPPLPIPLSSFLNPLIPAYHAPTFRTLNISRSYALLIKLSIECTKQECSTEFTVEDSTLLAGCCAPRYEGSDGGGHGDREGPPTYERTMAAECARGEGEREEVQASGSGEDLLC